MKIINAQAVNETMTEEETKNFLANNAHNLLMRIGMIYVKKSLSSRKKIPRKFSI